MLNEGRSFSESHQGLYSRFKDSIKEWIKVRKPQGANKHSADNDTELTSSRQLQGS